MANYGARIGWVTGSGDDPEVEFDADAWKELEAKYGHSIPDTQRHELVQICSQYLFAVQAERSAATVRDVQRIAKAHHASFRPFIRFAWGERNVPKGARIGEKVAGDAYSEFESLFESELEAKIVPIKPNQLRSGSDLPDDITNFFKQQGLGIALDTRLLMNFAIAIAAGLERVGSYEPRDHDGEPLVGFVPGKAFDAFLLRTRAWAETHGLPRSYKAGGKPGPLARLVFALNRRFPAHLRDNVASEAALYDRYRDARLRL